jgi:hypothetical protein
MTFGSKTGVAACNPPVMSANALHINSTLMHD